MMDIFYDISDVFTHADDLYVFYDDFQVEGVDVDDFGSNHHDWLQQRKIRPAKNSGIF
ncbi:MAG: hypothetical protein R8G66_00720 [Cytophagales bacterium]|nr:hypothetical protein [Cytophagales bacterium]